MLSFLRRSWAALFLVSLLSLLIFILPCRTQAQDSAVPISVPAPPMDASDLGGAAGSDGSSQAGVSSPAEPTSPASPIFGGYYEKTSQTGGVLTENPSYIGNYSAAPLGGTNAYYWPNSGVATYGAYGVADDNNSGFGYSTCTGQITTTYTWRPAYPGQLPPQWVITEERSEASYYGYSGDYRLNIPAPGMADDGLGDPVSSTNPLSGFSKGTRYKVVTGMQTITITCSPSATVTSAAYGDVWVYYSASVFPIVLEVWGTTPDVNGNPTALVGQGLHSDLTIVGDGVAGHPFSPITFSNYTWNIPGAVKGFFGDTATNPHHGYVAYLTYADTQSPYPKWYGTQGTPSGTVPAFFCHAQVNAGGKSIRSAMFIGHIKMFSPSVTATNTPLLVQIVSPGTPDASLNSDMTWTGSVSVLPSFPLDNNQGVNNAGYFYYTQLCSLDRDLASVVPFGKDITVNTGGYVLDTEVVYSTIDAPPYGTWWADGKVETSGDVPSVGLDLKALVTQQDAFKTFLMYVPPGMDTMAVPIHELDWKIDANAHLILNSGGLWLPKPPGTLTVTGDQSFLGSAPNWPGWDDVYIGTS